LLVEIEIESGRERFRVEIREGAGGNTVTLNGRGVSCDWVKLGERHYSLICDGRVSDLKVDVDGDSVVVHGKNGARQFRILDPRRSRGSSVEAGRPGIERIVAEMPGKVVRILVRPRDTVAYDQGLLVIEAMKMQNEIRAPKHSTVLEVAVTEGQGVNTGDPLLTLE
jgi:biotin carboxyl carrier protein